MDASTRVLVVDDHVFIAQLLREFVRRLEGYECVGSAVNGREAIEEIERLQPDIVVTDLDMPKRGGAGGRERAACSQVRHQDSGFQWFNQL